MSNLRIPIVNTSNLPLPAYQSASAACLDLLAVTSEPITLNTGERYAVPTGIHVALPEGYELQIRGRSGLAAKQGISVMQGIGTIDADYRGEIFVILINHGQEPFVINHGDRIAQAAIRKYEQTEWQLVDILDKTERNHGRFGSTGK